MTATISAKELRLHLGEVVSKVRRGRRYTVLYRSRPAFDVVPVGEQQVATTRLDDDALYRAEPVGASSSGDAARRHDEVLYR